MASGFTKKQIDSLNELFGNFLAPPAPPELPSAQPSAPPAALPSALQLCSPAPSELPSELPHPHPIPAPVSAQYYTPSPSGETVEEVGYPLRNIKQMRKKHGASRKTYTSRLSSADICVGLPTGFGGSYMCFSRDKDLDAWYTTMLSHTQKLANTSNYTILGQCHAARHHHFYSSILRFRMRSFDIFDLTFLILLTSDYPPPPFFPIAHLLFNRSSLVASNAPSDTLTPLFTSISCGRSRSIVTSGEGILASWNSAPVPPTTRQHGNAGYADYYR